MKSISLSDRRIRLLIVVAVIAVVCVTAVLVFDSLRPYAITVGSKEVAVVQEKTTAENVIREIVSQYAPEDTEVSSIAIDKQLKVKKLGVLDTFRDKNVMSKKEAVDSIIDKNEGDNPIFKATIDGMQEILKDYEPEPEYEKDDSMYAGDSRIISEAKKGKAISTYEITSVNGIKTDIEKTKFTIVQEGTPAVIAKGTLGLPEGADWKTYEGDPVYKDGEDLIRASQNYIGAPYRYGGSNLKTGVSCIGFVRAMYKKYGINIPMSMTKIRSVGVGVSLSNAKAGDIICYKGHVALYMGNGRVIDSTSSRGVGYSKVHGGIITIRRVVK